MANSSDLARELQRIRDIKKCSDCGRTDVQFTSNRARRDGLDHICVGCRRERRVRTREYRQGWYTNKYRTDDSFREAEKAKSQRHGKARRDARRVFIAELKSGPCADCGQSFPAPVMEWDHRNPLEKSFTISDRRYCSEAILLAEVAKCDLLCANCHRLRHLEECE